MTLKLATDAAPPVNMIEPKIVDPSMLEKAQHTGSQLMHKDGEKTLSFAGWHETVRAVTDDTDCQIIDLADEISTRSDLLG